MIYRNGTCSQLSFYFSTTDFRWISSVKDNPPAKDGLSVDECEHIVVSMILENILDIAPEWGTYE
jgi:hypothetical protein